jgi:hypothetical protein
VLAAAAGGRHDPSALVPVAFVENEESDTQVWVHRNASRREALVAFRGTEQARHEFPAPLLPCALARSPAPSLAHPSLPSPFVGPSQP